MGLRVKLPILLIIHLASIALIAFAYFTRPGSVLIYPLCGGGFAPLPKGPGIYNGPCIAAGETKFLSPPYPLLFYALLIFLIVAAMDLVLLLKSKKPRKS